MKGRLAGRTKVWRGGAILLALVLALLCTGSGLAQWGPNTMNFQGGCWMAAESRWGA